MQVLVGATWHDPRANLQTAFPALAEYGVNVTSLERCGKFAFVPLKGKPERTVFVVTKPNEGNAWLVVKVLGMSACMEPRVFIGQLHTDTNMLSSK